ncbi:MAG TPA: polyprenyl synthetase family protein [Nitrospirae bacterium]|nr:polyprenyl synthetase family protein [Nitrospirota bacterium]
MRNPSQAPKSSMRKINYSEIFAPYREDMERVEKAIRENFRSDVALIPDISSYLIGGGGKRIRPLLVIVAARLCGYTGGSRVIDYSVVVEYIHAATLLHDDVVDEADLRRGSLSSNIKYGNQASVLVGDFLFAKSFGLMSGGNDMRVVKSVSTATTRLAEGEVLQLSNTCDIETTEELYMDTILRKTAALMMSCLEIGAIIGGASEEKTKALCAYGKNIGLAFQLMDDALDYTADQEQWGKPVGADLAEGKITLPLIRTYSVSGNKERELIRKALEDDDNSKENFKIVLDIIERRDAITYTTDRARSLAEEAKLKLSHFSPSPHLEALHDLASYIVERKD